MLFFLSVPPTDNFHNLLHRFMLNFPEVHEKTTDYSLCYLISGCNMENQPKVVCDL